MTDFQDRYEDLEMYDDFGMRLRVLSVSEFIQKCNEDLEDDFRGISIIGEVAEFKVSQGKWVFFSLKDEESTISCFLPIWGLHTEIEDGMKIHVSGHPKLTPWGKFSYTVESLTPVGEGSIKRAFELLKKKLAIEGLFDPARKRRLPEHPTKIGVISSTTAAGYADFCKIVNARWGGLKIQTCHTQVQGLDAPAQIIRALKYLNEQAEVEVIAIIRGGGSKDDLSCFNDEQLAREIARSRIPVITGIGHEVDESIADLVADARASTPSNCAELLTRDRFKEIEITEHKRLHARSRLLSALSEVYGRSRSDIGSISSKLSSVVSSYETARRSALSRIGVRLRGELSEQEHASRTAVDSIRRLLRVKLDAAGEKLASLRKVLEACNPDTVLKQGYAILRGKVSPGESLEITTKTHLIEAKITKLTERNNHD